MHKGLRVKKSAGQLVPEAALKLFLKNYPSCFGAAVAVNDGKPEIITTEQSTAIPLETVMEVQNEYKDKNVLMFFGNYPEGVANEDDVQPFTLLEGVELIGLFTGDYPGFHKDGSSHPNAWHAVMEDLWPTLKETFIDVCNRDVGKLVKTLQTPLIKRHITNMIVGSGAVTILANNGEIVDFPKNEGDIVEFSWGDTSDACGYVEAAVEAAPAKPAGRKLFTRPGDKKPAPAVTPAPAAEPARPAPGPAPAPVATPAPATAVADAVAQDTPTLPEECLFAGIAPDGGILIKPKDMSGDKNHKRKWYIKYCGYQPDGYKKGVAAPLKKEFLEKTVIKDLKDLKKITETPAPSAEPVGDQKLNTPTKRILQSGRKLYTSAKKAITAEATPAPKEGEYPSSDLPKKDLATHHIPDEVVMPFVSDTEKATLMQFIKTISQDSSEIIDPKEFQDFESRCPNFTDLTGRNFTEPSKWSDKTLAEFITKCPETTKVLLRNLMASNIGLHRSLEMLGKALGRTQLKQEEAKAA